MDDEKIYYSELIYKAFVEATGSKLGHLQALGELNWRPYAEVIRKVEGARLLVER